MRMAQLAYPFETLLNTDGSGTSSQLGALLTGLLRPNRGYKLSSLLMTTMTLAPLATQLTLFLLSLHSPSSGAVAAAAGRKTRSARVLGLLPIRHLLLCLGRFRLRRALPSQPSLSWKRGKPEYAVPWSVVVQVRRSGVLKC